ncbi:MAG: family 43 glycosylhydrolase [Ruminococcus sp.]|nr:family 43 glycosylhydrolase [Ruminococcus sp.]
MKKQAFNPYLPIDEYVPDGEPHVFGDRVYVYGSHDKEGGETFCMLDYVTYSAAVDDLADWRYEGVIYKAEQDPDYGNRDYMYAPDCVQGNDGKYYLYYAMSGKDGVGGYFGPISVAVSDSPAGKFEYLGYVRNADGSPMLDYVCFDPAVINDNGAIRLYYGTQYGFEEQDGAMESKWFVETECSMFNKKADEILEMAEKDSVMGPVTVELGDDMLTVKSKPRHVIPYKVKGTDFEEHPFFEGSSIRKVGEKYYFVYSSQLNHELCYAVSDKPDRDFKFGGTIVSNGDVGLNGRKAEDRLNMTGTTHGSIEQINGEWYVFYHRLTHKSDYSRQGCAEKIKIEADGSIKQAEITSCGLNGGALRAEGGYPAVIACIITNGHMPHGTNKRLEERFPNVNHAEYDGRTERFIDEISDGTVIGFRYFSFNSNTKITLTVDSDSEGVFEVMQELDGETSGRVSITTTKGFEEFTADVSFKDGDRALFLKYRGEGEVRLKNISF